MGEAYDKGKAYELHVAKLVRRKSGDKGAMRNRSSHTGGTRRSDIFTNLPIHIEAKHHENVTIKKWMDQAEAASSTFETAVVAFKIDDKDYACLNLNDLLDLFVQIADQQVEIEDLRAPIEIPAEQTIRKRVSATHTREEAEKMANDAIEKKKATQPLKMCRNGHITNADGKCMWKGCKYGIAAGKAKKGEK